MIRGINTAATGMMSMLDLNDVLANNLANINTPGFKQSIVSFKNIHDMAVDQVKTEKNNTVSYEKVGVISGGSVVNATTFDFKQGGIKVTSNPLDFAINGDGFFAVQTNNGEAYTRNGSFKLNEKGQIITTNGDILLGEKNKPITVNIKGIQTQDIKVDAQGFIRVNNELVDKIKVVDFTNRNSLMAVGNSLFKSEQEPPVKAKSYEVSQGSLESSNANVVESMVNSITGMRVYETLSKVVKDSNDTFSRTINQVGRIRG